MGKPSEARHSGEYGLWQRRFGLGRRRRASGQQVVSWEGGGAGRGNGAETEAWDPSCFLGDERPGNPSVSLKDCLRNCGSWTLVLLKPSPPAAPSTLLVNCDQGGCVLFCFERSRFPWVLGPHRGFRKCVGGGVGGGNAPVFHAQPCLGDLATNGSLYPTGFNPSYE